MKQSRKAKEPVKTAKPTIQLQKSKSSKRNYSMPPLKYDESYREYIIPPNYDAVIRFPIYMGSGEITISRYDGGELAITPPPHCCWDIEVKVDDGHTESDPLIFYTQKIVD